MSSRGLFLPCPPGGGGVSSFPTRGSGATIRESATTGSAVVGALPGPRTVRVRCRVPGQVASHDGYGNDAWSSLPDHGSRIPTLFLDVDDASLPGVPPC